MWICLNNGFISAVENKFNPDNVLVRARVREHLVNIFPDKADQIYTVPNSDYAVRIDIPKTELAKVITDRILTIDYNNFKNSVEDDRLHDMYIHFWQAGYYLQQEDQNRKRKNR